MLTDLQEAPTGLQARKRRQDGASAVPQCIAHRGYKAKYPENTMAAFRAAAEVGADAIETDLHLSRDGVVVLSHVGFPSLRTRPNLSIARSLGGGARDADGNRTPT